MALDLKKIDDRIRQLQEIRKIAADPELARLVAEFITPDDRMMMGVPEPPQPLPEPELQQDEVSEFVKGVLKDNESPGTAGLLTWKARKG